MRRNIVIGGTYYEVQIQLGSSDTFVFFKNPVSVKGKTVSALNCNVNGTGQDWNHLEEKKEELSQRGTKSRKTKSKKTELN